MKKEQKKRDNKKIIITRVTILGVFAVTCALVVLLGSLLSKKEQASDDADEEMISETAEDTADDVSNKTKRVGDETYGYVEVPENWKEMKTDTGKMYGGNGTYVSLLVAEKSKINATEWAEALENEFDEKEFKDIKNEEATINEKPMYKISGKFKKYDREFVIWIFDDKDDKTRYVGVEGAKAGEMDVINSYKNK